MRYAIASLAGCAGLIACLIIAGCASTIPEIAAEVPSLQYCSDVSYTRKGNQIHVEATCQAPIGGGGLMPSIPIIK